MHQEERRRTYENLVPNDLADLETRATRDAVHNQPAMKTDGVTGGEDAELVL